MNIFNNQLDYHIPKVKDKQTNYNKSPRLPWISKALLRSINRKNNLYYNFKIKGTEQAKARYTRYKNTLTKTIRLAKKKYFSNQLTLYKHDIQNTWKILKQAMNLTKNKSDVHVTKIRSNGEIIEDPVNVANTFNNYFSSIGVNLAEDIPHSTKHFSEYLGVPNPSSIFFTPVVKEDIIDIVSSLNNKKSPGYDDVNNFILKGVISYIVDPLVYILNLSLLNGQVPDNMKIAKVIPLYKKGDKLNVSNYRPISLLSSLSKILEKVVYLRTLNFFKTHNILFNFQIGFIEKHNTEHALLSLLTK